MDRHKMILRPRFKPVLKPSTTTTTTNNNNRKTMSKTQPQTHQGKTTRKKNSYSRVVLPHLDEELVIQEILTRLPVKSLMRFKCVSKRWRSTIRDDSGFIELHLSRSKKRPCHSLFVVPKAKNGNTGNRMESYLTSSLSVAGKGKPTTTVHHFSEEESEFMTFDDVIGPVNGLFGIVEDSISTVTIYNFGTREIVEECGIPTLLSKLRIRSAGYYVAPQFQTFFFGFDSTSKKYKVISIWRVSEYLTVPHHRLQESVACEVFTLGDGTNTWKKIDEELPPCCFDEMYSCYANNTIYWRSSVEELRGLPQPYPEQLAKLDTSVDEVLVALDLGSEKFRVIPIPNFVPPRDSHFDLIYPNGSRIAFSPVLREINGQVVISCRSNSEIIELYVFDEDRDNKENANTASNTMNWTKEIIELPIVLNYGLVDIYPLQGSDYILLTCNSGHATMKTPTFYSYNRKKKSFKMIMFDEWGSDFHNPDIYSTFVESLSPFR